MSGGQTGQTLLGGARTVTGSALLSDHGGRRLLVDCGAYHGERQWRRLNWETRRWNELAEGLHDEEFSMQAYADELVGWLGQMRRPPAAVYVVHGEERAALALAHRVRDSLARAVSVPERGEKVLVEDATGSAPVSTVSSSSWSGS